MPRPAYRPPHPRKPLAVAILGAALALHTAALQPLFSQAGSAHAQTSVHAYAIDAGPLGAVLSRFASDAGVVLSFDASLTNGKQSPGLHGSYSLEQGFAQLLSGSGLQVAARGASDYVLFASGSSAALELGATSITGAGLGAISEGTGSYTTGSSNTATKAQPVPA